METDDVCCICLELFDETEETVELRCKHVLHRPCLVALIQKNLDQQYLTCPICRTPHQIIITLDDTEDDCGNKCLKNKYIIPSLITLWMMGLGIMLAFYSPS